MISEGQAYQLEGQIRYFLWVISNSLTPPLLTEAIVGVYATYLSLPAPEIPEAGVGGVKITARHSCQLQPGIARDHPISMVPPF